MRRFPLIELQIVVGLGVALVGLYATCYALKAPGAEVPPCVLEAERLAGVAAVASAAGADVAAALREAAREGARCSASGLPLAIGRAGSTWQIACPDPDDHLGLEGAGRGPGGWVSRGGSSSSLRGERLFEHRSTWGWKVTGATWALFMVLPVAASLRKPKEPARAAEEAPSDVAVLLVLGLNLTLAMAVLIAPALLWSPEVRLGADGAITRDLDLPLLDDARAVEDVVVVVAVRPEREVRLVLREDDGGLFAWRLPRTETGEEALALAADLRGWIAAGD